MVRTHPLLASLPILALVACDGSGRASDVTVADSAGVRIVTSPAGERPWPYTLTEVHRIGGADSGAGSFTNAAVPLVRTDGRDRIFVLDRDRSVVAAFDSTGATRAEMGGKGAGPGEFEMAFELLDAGPGRVALFDFGKQSLVEWSPDGALLAERRLPESLGTWNGIALHGDTLFAALQDDDSLRTIYRMVIATPADTTVLDSLVVAPHGMSQFDCFSARLPPMFGPRFAWRSTEDRLLVARQSRYQVDLYREGRLAASLRRPIEPAASTEDDARRMYPDGWKVTFGGGGGCTIDGAEVARKSGMADRLPLIAEVGFGPDGTIWVRRFTFPDEPPISDVFDREGAYLGTVRGRGLPLGWLGRDVILFPIEDEATGVTVVGLFRLTPATGTEGTGT